ncbi:hypothetical protein GCM10011352_13260 [Marinobacterium zhoushanense]|uniref:Glycerol-3-phosphate acyltransferase n=1 Tax=Marinobacterium zhoushanense TaxID=1679163 RepID=A0ABQ1K960_9GAMM|nr:1-acyl-sn-glycerol-3-phosphate acyltransferase [Marinobacterium zhoushanense]GGB88592.1 hypothetical protein GCM10011352_13260 [Marinobacterium zhoushanense]
MARVYLAKLKRIVSGDVLESSARRRLIHLLLADERVQAQIHRQAEQTGMPLLSVESEALKQLNTLCADFSPSVVERLYPLFSLLLHHLYPRIELRGLNTLHDIGRTHQLVYLPTHRSHIDYLLISWALYRERLPLPQVAAGDNLNLPLLGPILRRGGAFFMRRRFLDDPLYTQLFRRYLSQLLEGDKPLEFFIEGGRSRTGRLLPARRGLLGMTLDAWQEQCSKPLALIPISINYDLCLENSQYLRELGGQPKKQESLAGLIGAATNLLRRCGGAYLNLGEPLLLEPGQQLPPAEQIGQRMLQRSNAATIATPLARLACLLPGQIEAAVQRADLVRRLSLLNQLLRELGVALPHPDPCAEEIIADAIRRHQISAMGERLILTDRQAAGLCFYRNGLSHALILPGMMLLLVARLGSPSKSTVTRLLRALLPYLNAELHLPEHYLQDSALASLRNRLLQLGLLVDDTTHLRLAEHPLALTLIRLAEPVLLRQYLLIMVLEQQPSIEESQLLELVSRLAGHIHLWYGYQAPDYADKRQLAPMLKQLDRDGLLSLLQGVVEVTRELKPLVRTGQKLLPPVLLQEAARWLQRH